MDAGRESLLFLWPMDLVLHIHRQLLHQLLSKSREPTRHLGRCSYMSRRPPVSPVFDARLKAGFDLIGRTGATHCDMRYQDEQNPVVWLAVGSWGGDRHEAAAGLDPLTAILRLCEQVCDGGTCTHCKRPVGFEPSSLDKMPCDQLVCWYQYDPELATFRRACEGK